MEVDGRKLRKSLYHGSDDVHDLPCSPCAKEGKNVATAKHCVECDENLCTTCLNHHNKFSVMKGHQLLDKVKTPSGHTPELPSHRCDRHSGKLIDVYCPGHDKVGCSTCLAVEHSTCRGISFVPDVAIYSKNSEELQHMESAINNLQSRFIALKQRKHKDLVSMKQEKDKLLTEIRSERRKIKDQLDKMKKELLDQVETSFHVKMQNIDADIKEVEDSIASLRKDQRRIQTTKSENESEKYVQVKLSNERNQISKARLDTLKKSNKLARIWFDPCNQVACFRNNIIGRVIKYSALKVGKFIGEFDMIVGDDNATSIIYDMCLCTDGNIVITDYSNKRIKKMNESYSVTSCLAVNDNPVGICQIDAFLLAITLPNMKKVQFVAQKEPMTLQKSFNVGDRCRGIAYNDGLIYVCCGGSRERNEGVGHLEVFTLSGTLAKSYYGEMGCPGYVTVPNWTTDIYVSDSYVGLFIINTDGTLRKIPKTDINYIILRVFAG